MAITKKKQTARLACLVLLWQAVAFSGNADTPTPDVIRHFPPPENEPSPPKSEKFIIFAREPTGQGSGEDLATAWEFLPGQPEPAITKRIEFAKSSWAPDLLLWPEYEVISPEFVRVQVDEEGTRYGYRARLYHLNYRTWDVSLLMASEILTLLRIGKEHVYLSTGEGIRVIDQRTGTIQEIRQDFELEKHESLLLPDQEEPRQWIPEYLGLPDQKEIDPGDVVIAFLQFKGLKIEKPVLWGDIRVGFSQDHRRFLAKITGKDAPADFFYADLEEQTLTHISPAPALGKASDLNIYCVEVP